MKKKNILLYIIGLLAIYGCRQEFFDELNTKPIIVNEGDRVKLNFSLVTSDFSSVSTRMTTEEENQWDVVWMAQFDENGDLVGTPQRYNNEDEMLDITASSGENTLYFVTNVTIDPFLKEDGTHIANLTELKERTYKIDELSDIEDAKKIVMVGVWKGELIGNIISGGGTQLILNEIVVYARRLTSKINIVIEATLPNVDFQEKKITVEKMQLCAVPLQATFMQGSAVISGDQLKDFDEEVYSAPTDGGFTYNSQSYYVLENMQGEATGNDGGAPMKGNYAPKDAQGGDLATYVKIRAYIDDGVNAGHVDYRVYLGKNADKSFDIERNFHYTITIKIQGRGPKDITTDVRIESIDDLHQLQLQTPSGGKATNRGAETRNIPSDNEFWGWKGTGTNSSLDHLKVYTGGADWTLESLNYTTMPTNSAYVWEGLYLQYNTPALGDEWRTVVKDNPVPADAKIRLITGINSSSYDRTATITVKLHNVPGSVVRRWNVKQYKGASAFNMPAFSFFPGEAGTYAIAIRSAGATMWKFESKTVGDNQLEFVGTVGDNGFKSDINEWQTGHGSVLFKVSGRGQFTGSNVHRELGTVKMVYKASAESVETSTSETKLNQLATAAQMLQTKNVLTGRRFAFDYTSDPLFTTVVGFHTSSGIPWSINMLDGDHTSYDDNKGLVGTTSPVTGKENTLEIFNKMDKEAAKALLNASPSVNFTGTPVFSPAGICMSMNKEYWEIENVDDERFEWYLPSRNEALMDVFVSMLGLSNGGNGIRANIWTSTVSASTTKENSAYFAGFNVDVSAIYSVTSNVRCIRKKKDSEITSQTYPYLKNVDNTPVVIVREDGKGFVDRYRAKPTPSAAERYYRIDYPLRFTTFEYDPAVDGKGPIETLELTMSPKFQVAKRNATASPVVWYVGAGWIGNLNFKNIATDPETGCQAYVEEGENGVRYNDWRLPTEMELRLIGLLGAGMTASDNQKYILQKDGVNFTDIPGFVRMDGNYWTGTEYISSKEKDIRANYITIRNFGHNDFPLRGTAINRTSTSMNVRCVRDVH